MLERRWRVDRRYRCCDLILLAFCIAPTAATATTDPELQAIQ